MANETDSHPSLKITLRDTNLSHMIEGLLGRSTNNSGEQVSASNVTTILNSTNNELKLDTFLGGRIPISLKPKPGSLSHLNLARFLLTELNSAATSVPQVQQQTFSEIVSQLEAQVQTIISRNSESTAQLNAVTELFDSDFEISRGKRNSLSRVSSVTEKQDSETKVAQVNIPSDRPCEICVHQSATRHSQVISGFISIDWEEQSSEETKIAPISLDEFRSTFRFINHPSYEQSGHEITLRILASLPAAHLEHTEFFVHWGNYDDLPVAWHQVAIEIDDITPIFQGLYQLEKTILVENPGQYGATIYARLRGHSECFWQGRSTVDDAHFKIAPDLSKTPEVSAMGNEELRALIKDKLQDEKSWNTLIQQSRNSYAYKNFTRVAFQVISEDAELKTLFKSHVKRMKKGQGLTLSGNALTDFYSQLGVGEVVMVSPEGPHAISGGLAQVTTGFLKAFANRGLPITLIAPLYEASQGNKHKSAETYLRDGINLNGHMVPIKKIGNVNFAIGPTYWHGGGWAQHPTDVFAEVYAAQDNFARIIFIRQPFLAHRLYEANHPDSQLRSSIFLSRAALEIMRNPAFGIEPSIIISNDWLTALVPVLMKTDPKYSNDEVLSKCTCLHMLHNCGRTYQGKLPLHYGNQDLWPMLGIDGNHYYGLKDPWDNSSINLTVGAATHSSGGLLTVSQPYSRELLSPQGSEGLLAAFGSRASNLYGVSNGVDLTGMRQLYASLAENARLSLGLPLLQRPPLDDSTWLLHLEEYKRNLKKYVQRKYGLSEDEKAPLLSMVGRLAEQKGIQLLTAWYEGKGMLHALLNQYPNLQLIIAGPLVDVNGSAGHLKSLVEYLQQQYPGRVRGVFDFVRHREALELTAASDLFFMPSRYEPGGLTQLEAMAGGTPIIGHKVGGISATVEEYNPETNEGNGFLFDTFNVHALYQATKRALDTYANTSQRHALIRKAAHANHDWDDRMPQYLALFQKLTGALDNDFFTPLHCQENTLRSIKAVE